MSQVIFSNNLLETVRLLKPKYSKVFLVTDENIRNLYQNLFDDFSLDKIIVLKPGEKQKNFKNLQYILESILQETPDRNSALIGFGGGVVGDIAGLAASLVLRGIDLIQIPTTLLSAVDSSIGGKTAINSVQGKNLIGSFYPAKITIIHTEFLKTLSKREFLSGYAEILKIAMIMDKEFYSYLQKHEDKTLNMNQEHIKYIIEHSRKLKTAITEKDPTEKNERKLLNFGHSFAHSFEKATNYSSKLLHGEAVAIGMLVALYVSKEIYSFNESEIENYINHLKYLNFSQKLPSIDIVSIIENMKIDKKNTNGNINLILLKKLGEGVFLENIDQSIIINSLRKIGFK